VKPGRQALKALGFRLAILSNREPTRLEAAARSAGILPLLDHVVSVEEVKIFQPSRASTTWRRRDWP
jgi:FMN phosphatase YigB (HAD superfamily)